MDACHGIGAAEESIMSKAKHVQREGERIAASLKAVLLFTVIGIVASVVVFVEVPQLIVAPDTPMANIAEVFLTADGPPPQASQGVQASHEAAGQADRHASASPSEYFPARFGAPTGAAEAPAPTF
jgi:hypothetical protein